MHCSFEYKFYYLLYELNSYYHSGWCSATKRQLILYRLTSYSHHDLDDLSYSFSVIDCFCHDDFHIPHLYQNHLLVFLRHCPHLQTVTPVVMTGWWWIDKIVLIQVKHHRRPMRAMKTEMKKYQVTAMMV